MAGEATAPRPQRGRGLMPAAHRVGWPLAGAALLAWLVATALTATDPFGQVDAVSYWAEADALIEHGQMRERFATGTTPSTWRPPLYGGFLAGLRAIGPGPEAAVRANQLLVLVAAALLTLCARRLGVGRGVSAAAGLAYLWHPAANRLAASLMSESLFMVLALGALALAGRGTGSRRCEPLQLIGCGLLCGLALLTRTVFYAWIPGVLALAAARPARVGRAAAAGLVAAGLVAAVAPWTVRNALLHRRLVIVNTASAYNLWVGNALDATRVEDAPTRAWLVELRAGRSEVEVADELSARAWAAVTAAPGDAVARWARNSAALWTTSRGAVAGPPGRLALAAAQLLVLLAAALALWRQPRRHALWALASIPLLTTGLHALTFVESRFVLPPLAPALLLAAVGLGLRAGRDPLAR